MSDFLLAVLTPISDFLWWGLPYLLIVAIVLPLAIAIFTPLFFIFATILGGLKGVCSALIEQNKEQNKTHQTIWEIGGIKRLSKNPYYR